MKHNLKRFCSLLCIFALLTSIFPSTFAAQTQAPINLILNPGFDDNTGWTFTENNTAGVSGGHFWLTNGGHITQELTIQSDGVYTIQGVMKTSNENDDTMSAKFGVRYVGGEGLEERDLGRNLSSTAVDLGPHTLQEGDKIEIYVSLAGAHEWNWINGDDISVCKIADVAPPDVSEYYGVNLVQDPQFKDAGEWTLSPGTSGLQKDHFFLSSL